MAKKENFHPYNIGTEHGVLSFGRVRKSNQISACMLQSGPDGGRHYITMDSTGSKEDGAKGSTKSFSPGTFTIKAGKDIINYPPTMKTWREDPEENRSLQTALANAKPGEPRNIPAIVQEAENGDIIISALQGRIILQAEDIQLISKGHDGKKGVITLNADEKIILDSQIVDVQSKVSTKIFSEKNVDLIGKGIMNVYGGLVDFADGATRLKGSKDCSGEGTSINEEQNK